MWEHWKKCTLLCLVRSITPFGTLMWDVFRCFSHFVTNLFAPCCEPCAQGVCFLFLFHARLPRCGGICLLSLGLYLFITRSAWHILIRKLLEFISKTTFFFLNTTDIIPHDLTFTAVGFDSFFVFRHGQLCSSPETLVVHLIFHFRNHFIKFIQSCFSIN